MPAARRRERRALQRIDGGECTVEQQQTGLSNSAGSARCTGRSSRSNIPPLLICVFGIRVRSPSLPLSPLGNIERERERGKRQEERIKPIDSKGAETADTPSLSPTSSLSYVLGVPDARQTREASFSLLPVSFRDVASDASPCMSSHHCSEEEEAAAREERKVSPLILILLILCLLLRFLALGGLAFVVLSSKVKKSKERKDSLFFDLVGICMCSCSCVVFDY